jgi:SAM-dependent methyltransferase/acyl carrier protein
LDLSVDRYKRGWDIFERLTNAYIATALVKLGAFQTEVVVQSVDSLVEQTGVKPEFKKLLERWLKRLVEAGLLQASGTGYVAQRKLQAPALEPLLQEADANFGEDRTFLDYVVSCGSQLPAYITGAISTLETLFPGGSFKRAEDLYEHAPLSAYFAGIGRASMEALVRARRGSPIRVVEVGAGTGATSSALLPVLPPDNAVYDFTDLSDFFLNHARSKFARYGFVRYGRLDAEQNGTEQGYPEGSFDVVVATNVLHATRDIRETLRRIRSLLAPGGILLLCEVTTYLPWFDITTGLIEGWQLFEDGLRDEHPLLPSTQWTDLLTEVEFEHVIAFPEVGSPAEVLGQHVILAQVRGQPVRRAWTAVSSAAGVDTDATAPFDVVGDRGPDDLLQQLEVAPASDRREMLIALVRGELARSLRVKVPETLERKRRLVEFGIDSLMAVELRNRLAGALKLSTSLSATLVFDHPSIDALAEYLERDILGYRDASASENENISDAPDHAATSATAARVSALEQLSEEEAEALLMRRLQSR